MIVACEKEDDMSIKKYETFFSSNKSELQVKSFRSKSCPKLKDSHIHRDNSNNSSFILNQENEEDSESSFDNERNKKKEEVEKIRINLLQNTCSINKKNIGNNSSNNLNNLTSNNNKIIHSNASTSSFGRNFILKSDVCKSSISNYHNRYQDETGNPWVSYYEMDKKKNPVNDYWFFPKKNKKENENEYGSFISSLQKNKKKIIFVSNVEDEERVKYVDGCEEEEENDNENDNMNVNNDIEEEDDDDNLNEPMFDNIYQNGFINSIINSNNVGKGVSQQSQINSPHNPLKSPTESIPFKKDTEYNKQINPNIQNSPNGNINISNNIINYHINHNNSYYINNPQNIPNPKQTIPLQPTMPPMMPIQMQMRNNLYPQSMASIYYNQQMPMKPFAAPIGIYGNQPYSNYSDAALAQIAPFLIKEQTGCRYIQEKVQSSPQFANTLLFPFLVKAQCIPELVCDQFGNYLFQVLIDVLTEMNITNLVVTITPFLYQICVSPHGTRVIQKLIEKITLFPSLIKQLIYALKTSKLIEIIKDPYGNHIIQKFLVCNSHQDSSANDFIYDIVEAQFISITNSKHGVCVVQKCVSEGNATQKEKVLNLINTNIQQIITDQFGNYLIQYLLTSQEVKLNDIDNIIQYILENIFNICKMKFSANVIEKCFENSNDEIKSKIIISLVRNGKYLIDLLMDQYGNYVVQKALLVTKGELYMKMLTIISKGINELKQTAFGNKLIVKLINTHKELGNLLANSPHGNTNLGGTNSNNNYNVNTYGGFNGHNKRNNNWKK